MPRTETSTEHPTFKLPSYEEAIAMPTLGPPNDAEGAPPPYIYYAENPLNNETRLISSEEHAVTVDTSTIRTEEDQRQ